MASVTPHSDHQDRIPLSAHGAPTLSDPSPFAAFDALLDLERSRAFHAGQKALSLACMGDLLDALDFSPGEDFSACVHVAGSEGKTSVSESVGAGLRAAGLATGVYTSPHLRDPRERMRLDGRLPDSAAVRSSVEAVWLAGEGRGLKPSWFEAMTATAWQLFRSSGAQAAVWETGLGGRLDATRLLPAHVCVITSISLEHTAILGHELAAIAREKAGIVRPGVPLVAGRWLADEVLDVFREVTEGAGSPLLLVEPDTHGEGPEWAARNRALAYAALEAVSGNEAAGPVRVWPWAEVRAALGAHRAEGRDEFLEGVLYDGAHTVAAVEGLARRLNGSGPVLFGATSGRDVLRMASALLPVANPLVLTRAPGSRGEDPAEIARALREQGLRGDVWVVDDPHEALAQARRWASGPKSDSHPITVTGSLHLIGLLLPSQESPT